MKIHKKLIIWDIDGTLLNTESGIVNSVRYTEKMMKLNHLTEKQLKEFLGPPPRLIYKKLYGLNDEMADNAVRYHREYGMTNAAFEAEVYDGIGELLDLFKNNGVHQGVATLKGQKVAELILKKFNLYGFFEVVAAMNMNETKTKTDTITECLNSSSIPVKDAVLIGDSRYDAIGAREAGVDFIGVTYGFGFKTANDVDEFKNIGVAESTIDLKKMFI